MRLVISSPRRVFFFKYWNDITSFNWIGNSISIEELVTHFRPIFHFYIPWIPQKTGLWRFQGIEKRNIGLEWVKRVKVFKNGPSKICERQPLKNLKWYGHSRFTSTYDHSTNDHSSRVTTNCKRKKRLKTEKITFQSLIDWFPHL